jgi:hypothetical protein
MNFSSGRSNVKACSAKRSISVRRFSVTLSTALWRR